MKINVQSPHFKVGEKLADLVNKKVSHLSKFNERILKAEVTLKFDRSGQDDDKVCEIRLIAPEKNLFAIRKCLTFNDAVTESVKALMQQIEKRKTKRAGDNNILMIEEEVEETDELV